METGFKTYFSSSPGLTIEYEKPTKVIENGTAVEQGGDFIRFRPVGTQSGTNGIKFGTLVTNDPKQQAWLDEAIAKGRSDVFGAERYYELSTPDAVKLQHESQKAKAAMSELERVKVRLAEQQALLDKMKGGK